ncbi:MAG: V-type ATP synthase subunit D [TACK group archaeon]|nr:V-type ATP synthase subunit D [TACK group archaeon]
MERMNVPPTRFNLLRLKREQATLKVGHDLLEEKREALFEELKREVMALHQQADAASESLRPALLALARAEGVAHVQLRAVQRAEVSVYQQAKSVMGVRVVVYNVDRKPTGKLVIPPGFESPSVEQASFLFFELIVQLSKLAELQASIMSFAKEMKRMQRRVNALENIFLPQYEETIRFISDSLEERDREELISLKAVKERKQAERRHGGW